MSGVPPPGHLYAVYGACYRDGRPDRRRSVVGMLAGARMAGAVSFHAACRFFSQAVWDAGRLGLPAARLIAGRLLEAGERTVPFGMLTQSPVITWYAVSGYHPDDMAARRQAQPWYDAKTEPSFKDMLTKLRKTLISARISAIRPGRADPEILRDYTLACAAAAAYVRNTRGKQDGRPDNVLVNLDVLEGVKQRLGIGNQRGPTPRHGIAHLEQSRRQCPLRA